MDSNRELESKLNLMVFNMLVLGFREGNMDMVLFAFLISSILRGILLVELKMGKGLRYLKMEIHIKGIIEMVNLRGKVIFC